MNEFNSLKEAFKNSFPSFDYKIWLADLEIQRYKKQILTIITPSYSKKIKIEEKFLEAILKIAKEFWPEIKEIKVDCKREIKQKSEAGLGKTSHSIPLKKNSEEKRNEGLILEENTFNNFLVYEENKLAFDFSQKVIEKIGYISPLYIYGKVGVGKTHLSQSIYHGLKKMFSFYKMKYINPNDFVSEYRSALKFKQDRNFRINYRSLDVLIIDDIQFFMGKEKSSQEFFDIFNAIYRPNKQMIFCSDREPQDLDQIGDRIKSRLSAAAILELKPPKRESRKKILEHFSSSLKTKLSEEVLNFLAENLEADVRKIKGAVKSIFFFQEVSPKPITLDFCKQNFNHLFKIKKKISSKDLLERISKMNQISLKEIINSNNPNFKKIRSVAIYLLRENTNLSLKNIGEIMGGITPASVLYTTKSISQKRKADNTIDNIIKKTFS